jgi:hypothetical protein
MRLAVRTRKILESLAVTLIPFALNIGFYKDPGFVDWYGLPYLLTPLIFGGFYGLAWGFLQLVLAILAGFVLAPSLTGILSLVWLQNLVQALKFSGPLCVLGWLAVGFFYRRQSQLKRNLLARLRTIVREKTGLKRKAGSLERVNQILESRVASQKDSITLLRSQVHKLASLNLNQALDTMLETIHLFTDMKSGSIWVPKTDSARLSTAAVFGWTANPGRSTSVGLDDSVEGYVFRNGKPFSVRMVLGTQEFFKLNFDHNLLTLPIRVKGRVWGVLNIEDLPFERYSLYTESVLEILLSLIEPYLADILDHEALFQHREIDADTGLPQLTQLYRTLEHDLKHLAENSGQISLVVIEVSNFADLLKNWSRSDLKQLFPKIKLAFDEIHKMKSRAFHFKTDSQVAFVFSGLDQDGTSFLCLDLLSIIPRLGLEIQHQSVPLEVIVGFSASHDAGNSGQAMIEIAEDLLELQRL